MRQLAHSHHTLLLSSGKLKKSHVQKGYEVLKKIEKVLGSVPVNRNKLVELANSFYSLIPHDFGMQRPPIIDSAKKIKKKMAMLEVMQSFNSEKKQLTCASLGTW